MDSVPWITRARCKDYLLYESLWAGLIISVLFAGLKDVQTKSHLIGIDEARHHKSLRFLPSALSIRDLCGVRGGKAPFHSYAVRQEGQQLRPCLCQMWETALCVTPEMMLLHSRHFCQIIVLLLGDVHPLLSPGPDLLGTDVGCLNSLKQPNTY